MQLPRLMYAQLKLLVYEALMRWSSRLLQLPRLMYAQLIARMGEFLRDAPRWSLRSLQVLTLLDLLVQKCSY